MPNDNYIEYDKKLDYIKENSSYASRVEILSEELVEATHEAQKLARVVRKEQPVSPDINAGEVARKLYDELCDVATSLYGMGWGGQKVLLSTMFLLKRKLTAGTIDLN